MAAELEWHGRLGSGGWGKVYEATVVERGKRVAVKVLIRHAIGYEAALRRFHREVRMQNAIEHPNVVAILDLGLDEDPPWYSMPLAEGDLLNELATRSGDEAFIEDVFMQILRGVQAAHTDGTVHRDIKPSNILKLGGGVWAVSDFGAGLQPDRETTIITGAGQVGTLDYIAPEQYRDPHHADRRCDVFSLGKVLLQMLTGQQPDPFRPGVIPGGRFGPIVDKATQIDPAHRFQSVDELMEAFLRAITPSQYEPPSERLLRLVEMLGDPTATAEVVDDAVGFLAEYPDRREFHQELVPRISLDLLADLRRRAEDTFRTMLLRYDEHISGGLEFSYCDVAADFYRDLVEAFDDAELFRMIYERLLDMGAAHNRWHVMGVVYGITKSAREDRIPIIAAAISGDTYGAQKTFQEYNLEELHPDIQAALVAIGFLI